MTQLYRLYIWRRRGTTLTLTRGKCIGYFARYKYLVAEAQHRAVAAGYPKSRWSDLFDWSV